MFKPQTSHLKDKFLSQTTLLFMFSMD